MTEEKVLKEPVSRELCNERSGNITESIKRVEDKADNVTKQLNRFLILTISTLIAVIVNFVTTLLLK